jgi:hypothetical protein
LASYYCCCYALIRFSRSSVEEKEEKKKTKKRGCFFWVQQCEEHKEWEALQLQEQKEFVPSRVVKKEGKKSARNTGLVM